METKIGVSEYRKEDYKEILKLSEDRNEMEQTWKKWKANKIKAIKNFEKIGLKTVDIVVTPHELLKYCREKGIKINGKSRANFISYKVMMLNKK